MTAQYYKVVTANRLREGDVVYLTSHSLWSTDHDQAEAITNAEIAATRLAYAQTQAHMIVGPYLADAKPGENGPQPVHFREIFRTRGPSNYPHGKQFEIATKGAL